jgi:RNA pyrophosphohydrolase
VSFWYPVRQVVSFKKEVYRKAMKEFAAVLFDENSKALSQTETSTFSDKKPAFSSHKQHYSKLPKRTPHKYRG